MVRRTTRPWWAGRFTMRSIFKAILSMMIVSSACLNVTLMICRAVEVTEGSIAVMAILTNMATAVTTHYFGKDNDENENVGERD